MSAAAPLLPGARQGGAPLTLGVLGGGQLGRMFVHAAQAMGYATAVLDPDPASPAGLVSHHHIQTSYTDAAGLAQLAACSAAITAQVPVPQGERSIIPVHVSGRPQSSAPLDMTTTLRARSAPAGVGPAGSRKTRMSGPG